MKRSIDETADRFDDMSDEYDDMATEAHSDAAARVVELALQDIDPSTTVLDIGAGTGAVTLELAPHVSHITALDISEGMLEKAREKAEERGIENVNFREGRFRSLGDIEVDIVVSNFAMHHLNDEEKKEAVEEIRSVLADRGRAV
ncbi:MAG: class I SAM-dependent methyltransferase, partial [Halobacteria archaeon]|nr:class I SAM-dependent methyltransferase [Halobacteria archaeon]